MTRITSVCELDEQLNELVHWDRFGIHLPGMSMAEIEKIGKDNDDIASKKLDLFKKWLKICPTSSATWENVAEALEKIGESTLASKISKVGPMVSCANTMMTQVLVSKHIVNELSVMHKSFINITESIKRDVECALQKGSMTIEKIVSRTVEEKAFLIPDNLWSVQNSHEYFKTIQPFYSFLDCYLIVCIATFISSTVASKALEYEERVDIFKGKTEVTNLFTVLEAYFQSAITIGDSNVHVTIIMEKSWGRQKIWLVEELIKVLFDLHKGEYQWFRVRPGSLVLKFLIPRKLVMSAIVHCTTKMEFMRLIGVIGLCIGRVLVLKEHNNESFAFHNSLLMACKCSNYELVDFLLKFLRLNINKSSEIQFLKEAKIDLCTDAAVAYLNRLHEFSVTVNDFIAFTEAHAIKFKSFQLFILEERPSLVANFFSSVESKAIFFEASKYFFNFLNCSFLVDFEISLNVRHNLQLDMIAKYSQNMEIFKKKNSIVHLKTLQMLRSQPVDTILVYLLLPNEWLKCSISMVEKLVHNIFALKHPDELQWFKVLSGSVITVFYAPQSLQKQLLNTSRKKIEFMRLLGIVVLKVGDEYILKETCSANYTFEKGLAEAKENDNADVLQFFAEIQNDLVVVKQAKANKLDENNNVLFECDPDSTALMIACASGNSKLVQLLLDKGADPNVVTKAHSTALMYAVYSGNHKIVHMLIEHNADINTMITDNLAKLSILHIVCLLNSAKILKSLIEKKPNLNVQDSNGFTPLVVACCQLSLSMVKLLLKAQANPNIPSTEGVTPLISAADANCLPIVECLLEAQANPNHQDSFGVTALFAAVKNNNFCMFMCLVKAHANPCIETSFKSSAFHLACQHGLVEMVEEIIKHKKPDFRLSNGMTPLYIASESGQIEIVDCLIEANTDPNILFNLTDQIHISPLFAASTYGHLKIVKRLLKAKANPNIANCPALLSAALRGNLEMVETLLQADADPNFRILPEKYTVFSCVCSLGELKIINRLLKENANPNVQDATGRTPLLKILEENRIISPVIIAALGISFEKQANLYEVVHALLNAKADPNIVDNSNNTPLHRASYDGRTDIVVRLLNAGAKPNIQTIRGITPLHCATQMKHSATVKALLMHGKADPNIADYIDEYAPLHVSCSTSSLENTQILLKLNANPDILDTKKNTPLHYVADLQVFKCLISKNASPNIQNKDGCTPLYAVTKKICDPIFQSNISNFLKMAEILLEAKADPNITDLDGRAPLHLSCGNGNIEIIELLLRSNADPNIRDAKGNAPIHYAVDGIHLQVLQSLISSNANPNFQNNAGFTPLNIMCQKLHEPIRLKLNISTFLKKAAEILLNAKANPNIIENINGFAPLHIVCGAGSLELTQVFLKSQADPNIQDAKKNTPLHHAVDNIHLEVLQCLISSNFIDPNIQNDRGCTPLYIVCHKVCKPNSTNISTFLKMAEILLEARADPNITDYTYRLSPLHIVCGAGSLEIMKILLKSNADPNIQDAKKNTPLHCAVEGIHVQVLQCLLSINANPNIQNNEGYTPLHIACLRMNHPELQSEISTLLQMVTFLLEANADPLKNSRLGTPLQIAIRGMNNQLISILQKYCQN